MARHHPSSISEVSEPVVVDQAEAAARSDMLQAQLKSSERLTEYYNQVVAELRASLEQIIAYAAQQRLIPRRLSVDELFADAARILGKDAE